MITFRNYSQVALWEEIDGQLSDGYWENAHPFDHWKGWCSSPVQVGEKVGIDFYPRKENYNLLALLPVIGERMLFKAALGALHPEIIKGLMTSKGVDRLPNGAQYFYDCIEHGWNKDSLEKWEAAGLNLEVCMQVEEFIGYTMKDLRSDLKDMKQIMKTHI